MSLRDRCRFIYSLAGTLIAGEWTAERLGATLRRVVAEHSVRWPKLAERVFAGFADKPQYDQLVAILRADSGLARAINRATNRKPPRLKGFPRRLAKMDEPPPSLSDVSIPNLPTEGALAKWFDLDLQSLRWRADPAGRNRKHPPGPLRPYRYRWIPRREGLPRLLEIPKYALKQMQRKILADILDRVPVHFAAHGFCAGRSIVSNAAVHCGKAVVLRFDLADFFPSVSSARIFRIFRTLGYPPDVARLLMGLCTTSIPADVWDAHRQPRRRGLCCATTARQPPPASGRTDIAGAGESCRRAA